MTNCRLLPVTCLVLFFVLHPRELWVLEYRCESVAAEFCSDGSEDGDGARQAFPTKQQAIDWIDSNYIYFPDALRHGKKRLGCEVAYLNPEDPDPITRLRKEVDCDTVANLARKKAAASETAASETGSWVY